MLLFPRFLVALAHKFNDSISTLALLADHYRGRHDIHVHTVRYEIPRVFNSHGCTCVHYSNDQLLHNLELLWQQIRILRSAHLFMTYQSRHDYVRVGAILIILLKKNVGERAVGETH